jgi:diguanylate cyclase (GGDEF)-like protein
MALQMKKLSDYSLTQKVFLIPLVAVFCFGAYLIYSFMALSAGSSIVMNIRDSDLPKLEAADKNISRFDAIMVALNTAAATGEKEYLNVAKDKASEISASYVILENLDVAHKSEIEKLQSSFNIYFSLAHDISLQMAEKNIPPSYYLQVAKMQAARDDYLSGALAYRDAAEKYFHESVAESMEKSERAKKLGTSIGMLMLLTIILLTWLVMGDIAHKKQTEARLIEVSHYDVLTKIPNRFLLSDRMKQAIFQTTRERNMMAVCYLDLDGFKPINDTFGHEAGDRVLVEIAKRIGAAIRGGDTVARLGGDEFAVLLLGLDQGEECVATLERLLATIAQPITIKNHTCTVSASIGVSIYPLDDEDPDILLRHADHSMYLAKQSGKNRFHIYDPTLDRHSRDQHAFLKNIRHALEQGQFELHYQPKINLRTKEMVGAEALIRWQHPERGLLFPAEFLRHIDNTDLDIEIGEWVTATALTQMHLWRSKGLDIKVSINISGYHLESAKFVGRLQQQLAQYPDLPHGKLQIEVLETVALDDISAVSGIIDSCRKFGVGFALDDFGTGYSSLSYLSGLPVDTLKIDQSFVRDMLEDKGDMAIVLGIIALAKAFDREIVAEGIETEEQYKALLDMGCELGQGYGIGRPMTADKLANWRMS